MYSIFYMKQNYFGKGVRTLKSRGMSHKLAVDKMKYYATKNDNQWIELSPKAAFYLILVILFVVIGVNKESVIVTKLFAGAIAGMITSEAAGSLVKKFGGERLKHYSFTYEKWIFKFSISAFAIVVTLFEIWLFT